MRLLATILDSKALEDKPEKFKIHFRKSFSNSKN